MENHNLSDYELVNEFISGSQAAIETLVNRHKKKVFTYILINVKDRELAEDIFQDTFIKVIKSLRAGKYNEEGKFVYWIVRIAHNLVIDHFRKEKQLKTYSTDNTENHMSIFNSVKYSEKCIETEIVHNQVIKDVRNLIEELPDDQKEVVILRHYVGMSFKEIADHTNVSINTALGRMRYALINLRKLIEEKDLCLSFQ